ncbi:MAG: FlgD immunoglobulin-like domain containing protein [Planctomycetota bacterium]|jgi:hypothetical protein
MRNDILMKLFVILFAGSCYWAASGQSSQKLEFTRMWLDKKVFDPSRGENATLTFGINKTADVKVKIYDVLGRNIKSFVMDKLKAGEHTINWDGFDSGGKLTAGNVFLYILEAEAEDGSKITYNPATKTGGIEVKTLEYTFDHKSGRIEYVLPKASMVRIRAGFRDGMFGKSIFVWKPHRAGRHVYMWDGKDDSGMINMLKHPELDLRLGCFTLPDNTIITTGNTIELPEENSQINIKQREEVWATKGKGRHYQHDPRICHPPRFKVMFPTSSRQDDEKVPVVSGIVPIRVELDERDEEHLIDTRFEIMIFIDSVYVYEVEEGSSPFNYNWDTGNFARGPHLITVNILGYDDHIGIVSHKVIVGD